MQSNETRANHRRPAPTVCKPRYISTANPTRNSVTPLRLYSRALHSQSSGPIKMNLLHGGVRFVSARRCETTQSKLNVSTRPQRLFNKKKGARMREKSYPQLRLVLFLARLSRGSTPANSTLHAPSTQKGKADSAQPAVCPASKQIMQVKAQKCASRLRQAHM